MSKQSTNRPFSLVIAYNLCFLGLCMSVYSCEQNEQMQKSTMSTGIDTTQSPEIYIDLEKELKKHPKKSETVTVTYDAFFKTPKTFKGYALATFIDSIA